MRVGGLGDARVVDQGGLERSGVLKRGGRRGWEGACLGGLNGCVDVQDLGMVLWMWSGGLGYTTAVVQLLWFANKTSLIESYYIKYSLLNIDMTSN